MTIGHFIWTDLSTFDMALARKTYAGLFGWSFGEDAEYDFAQDNEQAVAAIFPMPEFLAKINMPSFWMSYVHVENLDAKVAAARRHEGAIIEIEPQPFDENNRIALVRAVPALELACAADGAGRFHRTCSPQYPSAAVLGADRHLDRAELVGDC